MSVTADKQTESKLDVFIKARNLLDYTLKITANPKVFRPDLKEHVRDIQNIIDENIESEDEKYLENIVLQLIKMLDNAVDPVENMYVWLIRELRDSASQIFICAWRANNIRVGADVYRKEERLKYQRQAITACADLKAYISLAKRMCHLKTKRIIFWYKQVQVVQNELTAWHNADKDRYKNIS